MNRKANPEWAVPGDTIEVTHLEHSTGNQHLVVKCPDDAEYAPPGCAWHENPNGKSPTYWREEHYKIVKRKNEGVSTPSIDLEKSLRQKRDQLLRGYFT